MPAIAPDQIARTIERLGLGTKWLITGSEPLLMIEAADSVRAGARDLGYEEREILNAAAVWDWSRLAKACQAMSLFGDKKIVELRLSNASVGVKGPEALIEISQMPLDGVVLIISIPSVDWTVEKKPWYQKLSQACRHVKCDPVAPRDMPRWLSNRIQNIGLSIDPDALTLMAERSEGNLLAAKQEVLKFSYRLAPGSRITIDDVRRDVSDVSRLNLEALLTATLTGDAVRAVRAVRSLQASGEAIPGFLWSLTDEIRQTLHVRSLIDKGQPARNALYAAKVYGPERQARVSAGARHLSARKLGSAIVLCADIDRLSKGLTVRERDSDPWIELLNLVTFLAKK